MKHNYITRLLFLTISLLGLQTPSEVGTSIFTISDNVIESSGNPITKSGFIYQDNTTPTTSERKSYVSDHSYIPSRNSSPVTIIFDKEVSTPGFDNYNFSDIGKMFKIIMVLHQSRSALLAGILNQNPDFHQGMSLSGLPAQLIAIQNSTSNQ